MFRYFTQPLNTFSPEFSNILTAVDDYDPLLFAAASATLPPCHLATLPLDHSNLLGFIFVVSAEA